MNAAENKPKAAQQRRSRSTQAAVLSAAIDVLSEKGYVKFSARAVATRAGVSRGALERYFPTKGALLIATVQYAAESANRYAGDIVARGGEQPIDRFLGNIETFFFSPIYRAMFELAIAAATDPTIERVHAPFISLARDALTGLCVSNLVKAGYARDKAERFTLLTHNLFRGIFMVETLLPDNMPDRRQVIETWSHVAEAILGPHRRSTSPKPAAEQVDDPDGSSCPAKPAGKSRRKV